MASDLALVPCMDAEHEDERRVMERTSWTSAAGSNGSARRRGKYCCVPHCTNGFYTREGQSAEISFFKFPNDKNKKLWLTAIKRQENKHPDHWKVTNATVVCEEHFKAGELKFHVSSNRKVLKSKETIPSVFSCWPTNVRRSLCKEPRKPPTKRSLQHCFHSDETVSENVEVITTKDPENVEGAGSDPTICLSCQEWKLKGNSLEDLSRKLKVENEDLSQKVKDLNEQIIYLKENEFNFESISEDTDTFKSYTGLPLERFKQLFKLVDPGQNAENMKYY